MIIPNLLCNQYIQDSIPIPKQYKQGTQTKIYGRLIE